MIESNENHSTTCTQGCSPLTIAQGNCKCFNWSSNSTGEKQTLPTDKESEENYGEWSRKSFRDFMYGHPSKICAKNFQQCPTPCQNCLDKNGTI